jgi:nitrate reductase cytochrome c-type subunit
MRGPHRTSLTLFLALGAASLCGSCGADNWVEVPGTEGAVKSTAAVRAARRAYDGAPPVIPHTAFGMDCSACHDSQGIAVQDVGYAPASPHENTAEAGATARCRQCHIFVTDSDLFVANNFLGLRQDLRPGGRLNPLSPPTIPHRTLMRENCVACHAGPGARQEIVTSHPERIRCRQCHVSVTTTGVFGSTLSGGVVDRESSETSPGQR